ncbi:hypothetical protein [Coralloluteibacterium stylophorae]|uniref:Uncharacterized protein n=1 Tax=Coralloluteibacterium stylophorae TaxID=1776034 RepID=A0A8J7VSW1_9GAMM|nr:hypothetical protein [Coralloluteibacterium stylophorae]MBS7457684.1 hypothetical protein [Coralloluteibacterium stylophorae]
MKFCKDCAFFRNDTMSSWCRRRVETRTSSVNGEPFEVGEVHAHGERERPYLCGPDAVHFKPKPTLWQRLTGKG